LQLVPITERGWPGLPSSAPDRDSTYIWIDAILFQPNPLNSGLVNWPSRQLRGTRHGRLRVLLLFRLYLFRYLFIFNDLCHTWPGGVVTTALELATQKVAGSNLGRSALSGNNLGQDVHTHVPLSPSSIIWYRSTNGNALRLGR